VRYFSFSKEGLYLKRYRCPDCHAVHTVRLEGFLPRVQTSIDKIISVVKSRIDGKKYLLKLNRQSQQYWWKGFLFQSKRLKRKKSLKDFLETQIVQRGLFTGKALKYRVIPTVYNSPYLSFAVTTVRAP